MPLSIYDDKTNEFFKNTNLIFEEIDKTLSISPYAIGEILKIHENIYINHSMKLPTLKGTAQNGKFFEEYILCYTAVISLKIEYIENNSLMLLPIEISHSSFIPLKNKHHNIYLNCKINKLMVEKLEDTSLYVYINFSPY